MEILSPAGNMDALVAAVRSGADAVYLGLKDFSARRNADNFTREQLHAAVEYCHIRDVKVYLTINTMIKESEMSAAVESVVYAYGSGVDAFIVSDLGLISVLHTILPQADLHASTQMTVHSPAAIKPLKNLGIKRIVLAREMSKNEIKDFCAEAKKEDIEVEVFVHGALCMCVSGQCLLSSMLGGRSGNRGLCAGPCRLEFSAAGSGRNDLSLKDLSLIDYLNELESMGVSSAKIEGRMKRPEYVAAATAACRCALDGKVDDKLNAAIKDVFSRSGFTDGYYTSKLGGEMFGIRTKDDVLSSKDALSFIHTLYRSERQSVEIKFTAKIKKGERIKITVSDSAGRSATVYGEIPDTAQTKATDEETVTAALSKLGGTPYFAKNTTVTVDEGLFVSAAALNSVRREAIEKLSSLRSEVKIRQKAEYVPHKTAAKTHSRTKIYARFSDTNQLPCDLPGVDGVILPFECDFSALPKNTVKIADLPRYITDERRITKRLSELKAAGVTAAYCGNIQAIKLAKDTGFKIIASNGLNCANSETLSALSLIGVDEVILSAEVNIEAAKTLSGGVPTGIFAYGRLPLMLTRNCPIKNAKNCRECQKNSVLKDRKGVMFPVRCRQNYSEVLNSTPICLADKQGDLSSFDFMLLYFTDETPQAAKEIISGYKEGLKLPDNFTRGLYYKNLP